MSLLLLSGLVSVVGFMIDFASKISWGYQHLGIVLQVGIIAVWVHLVSIEVQVIVMVCKAETIQKLSVCDTTRD